MSVRIVYVEKEACTCCAQCADSLPQFFQMDKEDLAESHINGEHINAAPVPDDLQAKVQREIDDCPGECIHWK